MTRILIAVPYRSKDNLINCINLKNKKQSLNQRVHEKLTVFAEDILKFIIIHIFPKVFNIHIGEFFSSCTKLSLPLFARFETPYKPDRDENEKNLVDDNSHDWITGTLILIKCHAQVKMSFDNNKHDSNVSKLCVVQFKRVSYPQVSKQLPLHTFMTAKNHTYTFLSFRSMPFIFSIARSAASCVSKCTKPYPFEPFSSQTTLKKTSGAKSRCQSLTHQFKITSANLWKTSVLYLAWQNVAECREGVIKGLIINGFIKVLDKDVANTTLSQRWITLGPHDADRSALDDVKVHCI